jgi:hypothetical protein
MFQQTAYSSAKLSETQEGVSAFANLVPPPENVPTNEHFEMQNGRCVSTGFVPYYASLMESCSSHVLQFSQLQSIE